MTLISLDEFVIGECFCSYNKVRKVTNKLKNIENTEDKKRLMSNFFSLKQVQC